MQSGQKGTLENNHIELRYILPKGVDLNALGLVDQDALNLVLSHTNSIPIEKFGGKTPLDMLEFMYPELFAKLIAFGIRKIPVKDLILKPCLLKKKVRKQDDTQAKGTVASVAPAQTTSPETMDLRAPSVPENTAAGDARTEKTSAEVKAPHSGGRKPKVSAISQDEVNRLVADGCSPKKIASLMGVSISTYYRRMATNI